MGLVAEHDALAEQVTALRTTLADAVELCESLRSERDAQARLIARDTATIANLRSLVMSVAATLSSDMIDQQQRFDLASVMRSALA